MNTAAIRAAQQRHNSKPLTDLLDLMGSDCLESELAGLDAVHALMVEVRDLVAKSADRIAALQALTEMAVEVRNRLDRAAKQAEEAEDERQREAREDRHEDRAMRYPEIYFAAPKRI